MNEEKVSVIIPFYNRTDETIRAVQSVFKQSYNNYEIILVNDGLDHMAYQSTTSSSTYYRVLYQIYFQIRYGVTGLEVKKQARPFACEVFSVFNKLAILSEKTPFLWSFIEFKSCQQSKKLHQGYSN